MATLFLTEQLICYSLLLGLSVLGYFSDAIPLQVNITMHSILIIIIGSAMSMEEMIR